MKNLEKGSDKVKKICDAIKLETIEPALEEARKIVSAAKEDAGRIIEEAERRSEEILERTKREIAKEKHIFETALNQASKQALESLRQEIEEKLFSPQIAQLLTEKLSQKNVIVSLIEATVQGIKEEGMETDLSLIIPKTISSKELAKEMASDALKRFVEKNVALGLFEGGIQVKCTKENLTVDISEQTLKEFLAEYIRKDLRQIIFRTA